MRQVLPHTTFKTQLKMKKDIETTISYWRDPGDGSLPNPEHDAEILQGHLDEENRKMFVRDVRGMESGFSLDTHGFEVHRHAKREREVGCTCELHGDRPPKMEIGDNEYFDELSDQSKRCQLVPCLISLLLICI